MATTPPTPARASSSTIRCANYFVHAQVTPFGDGLWIADRPGARAKHKASPTQPSGLPGHLKGPPAPRPMPSSQEATAAHFIFGSYKRLMHAKGPLLDLLNDEGQNAGTARDWDVHHVVEGDIYADVHFEDVAYAHMYNYVLPCVLLHRKEHNAYFHSVSRAAESREMHGVKLKGIGPADRRAQAAHDEFQRARRSKDRAALDVLGERVLQRETLFANLHEYSAVLRSISDAVFRRIRERLNEPLR